jgi:hypothetical protein
MSMCKDVYVIRLLDQNDNHIKPIMFSKQLSSLTHLLQWAHVSKPKAHATVEVWCHQYYSRMYDELIHNMILLPLCMLGRLG